MSPRKKKVKLGHDLSELKTTHGFPYRKCGLCHLLLEPGEENGRCLGHPVPLEVPRGIEAVNKRRMAAGLKTI